MKPLLFFDWDGTLAHSMPICINECRMALNALKLPDLPDEVIKLCNGPTYAGGCDILNIPAHLREEFMDRRRKFGLMLVDTHQSLFPGVRNLLDALKDKAQMVIVSNGNADYLEKSVDVMQVRQYFTHIQANRPGFTKAQLIAGILAEVKPERAFMIGDRQTDFDAGRANGLHTVAACFGYGNAQEYAQADDRADSVPELLKVLEKLIDNK